MCAFFKKKKQPAVDFKAPLSPEADGFLAEATAEFNAKQEALEREWRLADSTEWGYDQETGVLTLGFADGSSFEAEGQILGSFAASDSTWEWAWNNPHVEQRVSGESARVKELGERLGIAYLQAGSFPIPGREAMSYLCAIGLKATDSVGVYPADTGELAVMILLKNPRRRA